MSTDPPPSLALTIGWKERITFPEWGPLRLRAKVDTGACLSALDVADYELIETPTGTMAKLRLSLSRRHKRIRLVVAPVVRTTMIRNTSGVAERRIVIEALIRLGPIEKRIALTVTRRPAMRFRMLLGRAALSGTFIVDAGREYLLGR